MSCFDYISTFLSWNFSIMLYKMTVATSPWRILPCIAGSKLFWKCILAEFSCFFDGILGKFLPQQQNSDQKKQTDGVFNLSGYNFAEFLNISFQFRFSKKATQFETIPHVVNVKSGGRLFEILVRFPECPNFKNSVGAFDDIHLRFIFSQSLVYVKV